MNETRKIIGYLMSAGAITLLSWSTSLAQTNTTTAATKDTDEDVRFHKGEMDVSPFGVYVDQAGGKWGAGAALTYFITDKIGIGGATYWTESGGTFFDNAEFEGYFRIPVLKVLAPYALASIGYQFDRQYWFQTFGAGVDFRPFKRIDTFSDLQWRIADSSRSGDGLFVRIGARFSF
jgi:hypothetical protein